MGTTLNKLEYLDTTKSQIKTALNQFNAGITDNDTFRSYVDKINNIYDNWEKVSGEGTNIILNNTKKGKIDFEDGIVGYGDTKQAILPSEYQQVEYIESDTVSQYIDTGVILTTNTKINIDFAFMGGGEGTGWLPAFGVKETNADTRFSLFINNGSNKITPNYSYFDPGNNSSVVLTTGQKYNLRNDKGQFYVDNVLQSSISTTDTLSTVTKSVYLFANNNNGSVDNRKIQLRIYNCKFFESTALVRNFIPCYRKSDNVIGLYDTVGNTFYTNSGTGTFTKGANAPTPSTPIDIEVVRGTQTVYIKDENNNIIDTKTINLGEYELYADSYIERVSEGNYNLVSAYEKKRINVTPSNIHTGNVNTLRMQFNNIMTNPLKYRLASPSKCNRLKWKLNWNVDEEGFFYDDNTKNIIMRMNKTVVGDTYSSVTNYLENNNTYVVCELINPTTTPITDTTLINQLENFYNSQSFTGTTIIEIEGDLPMILKIGALKKGGN